VELEEEEEKRRRSSNKKSTPKIAKANNRSNNKGISGETTPLTGKKHKGVAAAPKGYGTSPAKDGKERRAPNNDGNNNNNGGWFGQLVSIVTSGGKSEDNNRTPSIGGQDEGRDDERRIQDVTKSYRDRGRAFLEQTEKERTKMKERNRMEELNNVTVPVTNQSFGGHTRARMSSMSAALQSIPSCGDSEEETTSSDEGSGSYFYRTDEEAPPSPTAAHATATRVWKYGEPPTTMGTGTSAPANQKSTTKNKATTQSKHDRIMERERLLQEEYEYRLHLLKRENETLSRSFRIFVLVTVAVIFAGALSFALAVCVKMLMSI